jgi:hypothetical protein
MSAALTGGELIEYARQRSFIDDDGCWQWLGGRTSNGYPVFYHAGATASVRREIFRAASGSIAPEARLSMTCGECLCVNPAHMVSGSYTDYMRRDRGGKRRPADIVWRVTLAQRKRRDTKLTLDDARRIRERAAVGDKHKDIAADHGVSRSLIGRVVAGLNWREPSPWAI